ncbi:MAG: DEAD/DEAH box helicase [Phycisphaerales bacterium]
MIDSPASSDLQTETSTTPGFDALGLADPIARVLAKRGYETPSPIQALAIPAVLEGRDVFGTAQTGTGKTAAFALPILHDLFEAGHRGGKGRGKFGRAPRALVLCPTRELAVQIFDSFVAYGRNVPLRHAAVYGGVSQFRQEKALKTGVDVLIATPGRLMDLHQQGLIDLGSIEVLVLDEADRMLDMGFLPDMKRIAALTPEARQTLLFSATASKAIKALANGLLKDPVHLETTPESTTVERIAQQAYVVEKANKGNLLRALLEDGGVGRALVFTKTKHGADRLVKQLDRVGVRAGAIHGNKTQNARTRALDAFKRDPQGVLIATDVASRGIDVSGITHVINFDMPADAETYVHRVGRTARAGASGVAITFCEPAEVRDLAGIEHRTKAVIEPGRAGGELASGYVKPERPAYSGGGGGGGGGGRGGRGGGGGGGGRGGPRGGGYRGQRTGGSGGGGGGGGRPGGYRGRGKPGGKPGGRSGGRRSSNAGARG